MVSFTRLRFFRVRLGAPLALDFNVADTPGGASVSEILQMLPFTIGIPIHFEVGVFDLYVVPTANWVTFFDVDINAGAGTGHSA